MNEVSAKIIIDMPRDQTWQKLRDLTLAHNYVPQVVKTEIVTDQKEGVGTSRKVYQEGSKGSLDETVTDWVDGHGFTLRVHKGDGPAFPIFNSLSFRYHLEDADGKTLFAPALSYEIKYGPLGAVLNALVLKKGFESTLRDLCLSMKDYYETGHPVTLDRLKVLRAAA